MRRVVFAVPGDLATPTGGYAYDRRMIAELAERGWNAEVLDVGSDFPRPSPAARATATERLAAIPAGATVVIDGAAVELPKRSPSVSTAAAVYELPLELDPLARRYAASIVFALLGIAVLVASFFMFDRLTPYRLWKEIIDEHNTALAILIGAIALGLSIIIAAAIH